ncbi:MAG TPA: hypothetical protein VIT21_04165 [Chthoniobacterales bacterium]
MNLDSVRELKQTLVVRVLQKIETIISARPAFGRAARPVARAAEPPRTLALGVSRKGKADFQLAVRVQRRIFEDSPEVDLITKRAKGEVDVRYVGGIQKHARRWYQQRQRPALIGCSVGHFKITGGTLGCFVQPRTGGGVCILSNNHVLADENRARKNDAILQPGTFDEGADPDDTIAMLTRFVRLKRSGRNLVDCAIATVNEGITFDRARLRGLGKLAGLSDTFLEEGEVVAKIGRTTGLTRGRVTAFELDNVIVRFDIGNLRFDNQIEIEGMGDAPFSDGGDSGSLIIGEDKRGVALLFAGGDQGGTNGKGLTYANPLRAVLDALKVNLAL